MRVFMNLSYIVTMMLGAIKDLQVFLLYFFILIYHIALIFDINGKTQAIEYRKIGIFWGNIISVLRDALGDSEISALDDDTMDAKRQVLYWIFWIATIILAYLIFMNFIIAGVNNSYQNLSQDIDAFIYKERAGLVL